MRGEADPGTSTTMVRFLVFCNDDMLLHQGADGRWDTPAQYSIAPRTTDSNSSMAV